MPEWPVQQQVRDPEAVPPLLNPLDTFSPPAGWESSTQKAPLQGGARVFQFLSDLMANTAGSPSQNFARSFAQISQGIQDENEREALDMYQHVFETGKEPTEVPHGGIFGGARPLTMLEKAAAGQAKTARDVAMARQIAAQIKAARQNTKDYVNMFNTVGEGANQYAPDLGVEPLTEEMVSPNSVYGARRQQQERAAENAGRADQRLGLSRERERRISQGKDGKPISDKEFVDLSAKAYKFIDDRMKPVTDELSKLRGGYRKSGLLVDDKSKAETKKAYVRTLSAGRSKWIAAHKAIGDREKTTDEVLHKEYDRFVRENMQMLEDVAEGVEAGSSTSAAPFETEGILRRGKRKVWDENLVPAYEGLTAPKPARTPISLR